MSNINEQQVWLIVGAAGGLGSAVAKQAANLQSPPQLVLLDKNRRGLEKLADQLESMTDAAISTYPLDLSGAAAADYDAMATAIGEAHAGLDAIVFCQAQCDGLRPMHQTHGRDWLLELHANLGGPQLLMQACLQTLLQSNSGRVVWCANDPELVSKAYWGAYGVAQSGLIGLAQQWSEELANTNMRFLLCYPGAMRTALRQDIWPAVSPESWPEASLCASELSDWLLSTDVSASLQILKVSSTTH